MPLRNQAETHRIAYAAAPPSFNVRSALTKRGKNLKIAGLMLYLGEGAKSGNTADLANSNPLVISLFIKMLRQVYGIDEKRLRVYLYCYANQNLEDLIEYWSKVVKIDKSQFTKPYVRRDFLIDKQDKMPYGLIHVRYSDKKLLAKLIEDINEVFGEI